MRRGWVLIVILAAGAVWWMLRTPDVNAPIGAGLPDDMPATAREPKVTLRPGTGATPDAKGHEVGEGPYRILGTVVDEENAPLAGVPVVLTATGASWPRPDYRAVLARRHTRVQRRARRIQAGLSPPPESVARAISGSDGRFAVRVQDPVEYRVQAQPAPPHVGGSTRTQWIADDASPRRVVVRVYAGVPLRGRVERSDGIPLQGRVRAMARSTREVLWDGTADSDAATGVFSFAGVPAKPLWLGVTLPTGRQLSNIKITPPFDDEVVLVVPGGAGTVRGSVTGPQGEAVANASVLAGLSVAGDTKRTLSLAATSDAEGGFTWTDLPPGQITAVEVVASGYLATYRRDGRDGFQAVAVIEAQAAALPVSLARGGSVMGTVTTQGDNAPVPGATVTLYFRGWHPPPTLETTTDAQGRYAFERLGPGDFLVLPSHENHYEPTIESATRQPGHRGSPPPHLSVKLTGNDAVVERNLVLVRGASLAGRVLDPNGTPTPGARIFVQNRGFASVGQRWRMYPGGMPKPDAISDETGRFRVDGLAPRDNWVLRAGKKGYASRYAEPVSLVNGPRDEVTLHLVPQCIVRGRVEDDQGLPVPHISVSVWGQTMLRGAHDPVQTGDDGTFEVDSLPAAKINLSVRLGEQQTQVEIDGLSPGEVREGVVLSFATESSVTGVVRTSAGEPVPRLSLWLARLDGKLAHRHASTDGDGAFRIHNVVPGRVQLRVRDGRGAPIDVGDAFDAPAEDLSFVFDPPKMATVSGMVTGPDGTPVSRCRILVANDAGGSVATSANQGRFEVKLEDKPPFVVTASRAQASDGTPLNARVATIRLASASEPAAIQLRVGATLGGRVVDATDKGLVNVTVGVQGHQVQTDLKGAWSAVGLPSGDVVVTVTPPPGYVPPAPQTVATGESDVTIVLQRGAEIRGKVVLPEGASLRGGSVRARWPAAGGHPAGQVRGVLQPSRSFVVGGLPPGSVVSLDVWPYQDGSASVRVASAQRDNVAAGTNDVEITLPVGVDVRGVVSNADGTPYAGGAVSLRGPGNGWARVGKDGRFEVRGLRRGTFGLTVLEDGRPITTPIEVTAPGSDVRVVVPERAPITGTLDGRGPEEAWRVVAVDATSGEPSPAGTVTIRADGTWQVGPVAKGREWVVLAQAVASNADRFARSAPVRGGAEGVTLTLQAGASIAGHVEEAGAPAGGVRVSARGPGWLSHGRSAIDGSFVLRGLPPGRYALTGQRAARTAGPQKVETGTKDVVLELR